MAKKETFLNWQEIINSNAIIPYEEAQEDIESDAVSQEVESYPSMYSVLLLNDDFTPMDFVMEMLEISFRTPPLEARSVALQAHETGQAVCGTFTHDVAETKVIKAMNMAKQFNHPLKCIISKES